jgi:glycosyltransferase involved in cell wall biosynthesis
MINPRISVVTVVYNGVAFIEDTILSVINQQYANFEYIIVDGNSNDGTQEVIKKYDSKIEYWVSEKDRGIYDAMNKGIEIASGDWVIFMNCGDTFHNHNVLEDVFTKRIDADVKLLYGGCKVRSDWGSFTIKARPDGEIWKSFTHQSMFSRIELNREFNFNLNFKAASDYDFVYRVFSKGLRTYPLDMLISEVQYISSGHSSINELLSQKEVLKSIYLNKNNVYSSFNHLLYHLFWMIKKYGSVIIRTISPKFLQAIRKRRDVKSYD